MNDVAHDRVRGSGLIKCSWGATVLFGVVALPAALGVSWLEGVAVAVALGEFVVSLGVWSVAFASGLARSSRGENVAVANLFLLQGSAPKVVQRHLVGSLLTSVVLAGVVASHNPFAVLLPMLSLGFMGMWGARHGTFGARDSGG